jgi:tetratricopeptide (TPR) repeat protein
MKRSGAFVCILILATVGCSRPTVARRTVAEVVKPLGSPSAPSTSRESLEQVRREMEARLRSAPQDAAASVRLADALLRLARVTNNAGLAIDAERVLVKLLAADADRYDARRMLAATLLSQHRFRDAIREAERSRRMQPRDAWPLGVIGDAHLELGGYDKAFDAFQQMVTMRPDAASYSRAAYARELQGDLPDALRLMQMALEATSPNDPESLAWHHAQIGALHLALGRTADAQREYAHAEFVFPGYPLAIEGLARVDATRGDVAAAVTRLEPLAAKTPTPGILAELAALLRRAGREADALRYARLAEAAWRSDAPEPARLAVFLADSGDRGRVDEAVRIAETASADRDDIFTNDALAWAYFKAGRIEDATRASARATRTGSVDRAIRAHARAIAGAATR